MTTNTPASTPTLSTLRRRSALVLPLGAAAWWLLPQGAQASSLTESRTLMGTTVDIRIDQPDTAQARAALQAAWQAMARLETMMSRYVPGNPVDALHANAGERPHPVAPELFEVLQTAQQLAHASRGAFDVTIGSLQDWDFRPAHYQAASAQSIRAQLPLVRPGNLVLDSTRRTAWLRQRGTRMDLGGVAKLPILHAGMEALRAHGVERAMVNGGGDVLVRSGPLDLPWRVGVRDPRNPDQTLGTIALRNGVVASSGDYERCFEQNGRRYHHVLNPRTGYPATAAHGAVLVAPTIQTINGWGAATLVAGRAWLQEQQAAHADVHALVVGSDRAVWASEGMRRLLQG